MPLEDAFDQGGRRLRVAARAAGRCPAPMPPPVSQASAVRASRAAPGCARRAAATGNLSACPVRPEVSACGMAAGAAVTDSALSMTSRCRVARSSAATCSACTCSDMASAWACSAAVSSRARTSRTIWALVHAGPRRRTGTPGRPGRCAATTRPNAPAASTPCPAMPWISSWLLSLLASTRCSMAWMSRSRPTNPYSVAGSSPARRHARRTPPAPGRSWAAVPG